MALTAEHITVSGKLPFAVLVEDGIDENNNLILNNIIEIADDQDRFICGVLFRKLINNNQSGPIVAMEDFFGEYAYSEFRVLFHKSNTKSENLEDYFFNKGSWDNDTIIQTCTELLNKFLTAYKLINGHSKDWIPFITKSRISPLKILVSNSQNAKIGGIEHLDYRGTSIGLGFKIDKDKLIKLKTYCRSINFELDSATRFIQEANRYIQTGDYKSAILFLAFYVEKWIFREIRYKLLNEGKSNEQISKLFMKKNGRYIDRYDAIKLVNNTLNLKNLPEYICYTDSVVSIRDQIVHKEDYYVDQSMTEKAASATMIFRDKLKDAIWEN